MLSLPFRIRRQSYTESPWRRPTAVRRGTWSLWPTQLTYSPTFTSPATLWSSRRSSPRVSGRTTCEDSITGSAERSATVHLPTDSNCSRSPSVICDCRSAEGRGRERSTRVRERSTWSFLHHQPRRRLRPGGEGLGASHGTDDSPETSPVRPTTHLIVIWLKYIVLEYFPTSLIAVDKYVSSLRIHRTFFAFYCVDYSFKLKMKLVSVFSLILPCSV